MRKILSLLTVLLVLAAAAALAACGTDEGSFDVSAADAASATRAADAAKFDLTAKMTGGALPQGLTITGSGVSATTQPKLDMTLDLGQLLEAAGQSGDGKLRLLLDGKHVYVDPPALGGLTIPGGKQWVTADLETLFKGLGIDASGFGELMHISPDQQLSALQASDSIKRVGHQKIDGVDTVHLHGTVKLADYLKALSPARRKAASRALKNLEKLPGAKKNQLQAAQPIDVWIGKDKLVRRLQEKITVPAQSGVPSSAVALTMNLHDYGTKLDVTAPPQSAVYDATPMIERVLKQASAAQGGSITG